ncbi:MAG: hypothetical protein ACE5SW_13035 [Nitrososphaeraceae archaeon]
MLKPNSSINHYLYHENNHKINSIEELLIKQRIHDAYTFYFMITSINFFTFLEESIHYLEINDKWDNRTKLIIIPLDKNNDYVVHDDIDVNYYLCIYIISEKSMIDITKLIFEVL